MRDGLNLRRLIPKRQRPNTPKEFKEVKKRLDAIAEKELPEKIRQVGRALVEKYKLKSKR
jgi:tetrahydromethanopterin S-methyltransferase subunit G